MLPGFSNDKILVSHTFSTVEKRAWFSENFGKFNRKLFLWSLFFVVFKTRRPFYASESEDKLELFLDGSRTLYARYAVCERPEQQHANNDRLSYGLN